MIVTWLNLAPLPLFLILACGFVATAAIVAWLTTGRIAARAAGLSLVAPGFVSVPAVLLALLTGFVASDTWERDRQATRIVQSEADDVLAVFELSRAAAPDMSVLRGDLHAYANAIITDEWPRMDSGESSGLASKALGQLLEEAAKPQIATEAGAPTQAALLEALLRLRNDRGARLASNSAVTDTSKWLALLILGVLVQASIGLVHVGKPMAQGAAQTVFTLGLVAVLFLIALHELPFAGVSKASPDALIRADAIVSANIPATTPQP